MDMSFSFSLINKVDQTNSKEKKGGRFGKIEIFFLHYAKKDRRVHF